MRRDLLMSRTRPVARHGTRRRIYSTDATNWYDFSIFAGTLALVTMTPFAMGAVHPWAFIAGEVVILAMVAVWMLKLALEPSILFQPTFANLFSIALPLGLFLALAAFQLLPLPPAVLRVVSPATYNLYVHTLDGWPAQPAYHDVLSLAGKDSPEPLQAVLPTPREASAGAPIPRTHAAPPTAGKAGAAAGAARAPDASGRWLPLSIAPSLSRELVLKLTAYSALFFLVLLYPFGPSINGETEKRFYRYLLIALLATGLTVSCIGILERVFWNGKILWIFVPYDWGRALPDAMNRARGPFVNPDHFGSYLNMVLPIAIAGVVFPTFLVRRQSEPFRVFCTVTVLVASLALLLSLSRAGWLGALIGFSSLVALSTFIPREKRPALFRLSWKAAVPLCALALVVIIATSSLVAGGSGRQAADRRLKETISQHQSLEFRFGVWRDTLPMVRDFPLFGIGLGTFQDIFAHYKTPPWMVNSIREAHNDYLELLASTGVLGFGLLGWFLVAVGVRLYRGIRALPPDILPVGAALTAGLSAMAFQEFFDFNLQIPANAILLTLLMALAFRLVAMTRQSNPEARPRTLRTVALPVGTAAAAAVIALVALLQPKVPYPYDLETPVTPAAARSIILAHPAATEPHLWMVHALGKRPPTAVREHEIATAVWLNPTDPYARDLYAQTLVWDGKKGQALQQVSRSVEMAPWPSDHFYLNPRLVPWLSQPEREAIERGLKRAIADDYRAAIWTLAGLYHELHQYRQENTLLVNAAASESSPAARAGLLISAGTAAAWSGDLAAGEHELREAAIYDPTNPAPYHYLATMIYAPRGNLKQAQMAIQQGIDRGADPFSLYRALADAAGDVGNRDVEESALKSALELRPADLATSERLASLYMGQKRYDRAVLLLKGVSELRPNSAEAFYHLAQAEEANYQFFEAGRDFARAVELAPQNEAMKSKYAAFQKRVAHSGGVTTTAAVEAP
jgi:O-antigen ligase/tetratricopeptide (TPR) repeat protein